VAGTRVFIAACPIVRLRATRSAVARWYYFLVDNPLGRYSGGTAMGSAEVRS